jgi:phosphatidylethanolamine-binding protein (PEBP) family uncharacterized protein
MGRLLTMAVNAVLLMGLTLAGCGGSSSSSSSQSSATTTGSSQTTSSAATPTQTSTTTPSGTTGGAQAAKSEHTPKVTIRVSSPAFRAGSEIPVHYTCDGANTSPPLKWGTVPPGAAELALFILGNEGEPVGKPRIYWAVTGLQPTLTGVSAGKLPPGAVVGRNSLGQSRYTICPAKSQGVRSYAVALLTLPSPVSTTPGFDAGALFETLLHSADYGGLAGFTYKRH